MKHQIVYVHGGHAYETYDAFLHELTTNELKDVFDPSPLRWSDRLHDALGDVFDVCALTMPNKQNANYAEWKIWFERHFTFFSGKVTLIGWSLGGMFLAKYLSENTVPFTVGTLYLIAAPADFESMGRGTTSFSFDRGSLDRLQQQVAHVVIMHSKDDPVVPYAHAIRYMDVLPDAESRPFDDRNHFLQAEFPELIQHIRSQK